MLATLPPSATDPILALIKLFREDPRTDKTDLGVGVYKDAEGRTPVFRAVREAERRLHEGQESKSYLGLGGDLAFADALGAVALGPLAGSAARVQTTGGTGALHTLARMARAADAAATAWMPTPTWSNHFNIIGAAGVGLGEYPWIDGPDDGAATLAALDRLGPSDLVILHGCCHNPTGIDPSAALWARIAESAARRGWVPFFDLAYQGFAVGLEDDRNGVLTVAQAARECLVAVSCSKTFGLYRDRAGAAFALTDDPAARAAAQAALEAATRDTISMPPDHGAAIVRLVLTDPALAADWRAELDGMRARMARLRAGLDAALEGRQAAARWPQLARGTGMFALLGLGGDAVTRLREDAAVYLAPGGRINVAGLPEDPAAMDRVAAALATT